VKFEWSWVPQADGTLRGVQTNTVMTNECGYQGETYEIPFVARRVGAVPPSAIIADSVFFTDAALFNDPTAPATTAPERAGD
jgi:serine/threonine protein kinase, bacterial